MNTPPKILIAFLGWVGGAKRGDHQALRDTWLKGVADIPNMDYKFFIGDGTPVSPAEEQMINDTFKTWANRNAWNKQHYDKRLQAGAEYPFGDFQPQEDEIVGHYPDGYHYMSYKRKESLRWALENGYDYIFCLSNDVYARPERLLTSDFKNSDYSGLYCGNTGYVGTPEYIAESYAFGGGFWVSSKAAHIIVDYPIDYWCEDWWVGLALSDAIKRGEIRSHLYSVKVSPYALSPRYPHADNDIVSVEFSAGGNYENDRMYKCHENFPKPTPAPLAQGPIRYDKTGLVTNWFDRHRP
jgi:hypothetical protein